MAQHQQQHLPVGPPHDGPTFKVPALPRSAVPLLASSTAGLYLGGAGGHPAHNHLPTRASVSAYDAKAIFNSFDTLPPLPSLPTSQNPHPAPDPSGAGAQFPHPSHPTSALSSLFLHVLPCFNGNALRNPIESLNALVTSHITATFARYSSPARVLATLTADLRDILGSGMLTLEAKLHAVDDDDRLVSRLVEVWVFFWTTVVPYVEGIFLPLTLDPRIVEAVAVERAAAPGGDDDDSQPASTHAIDARLHLLTLFLVSLLHPHLPRILPLLAPPHPLPSPAHLARLQQMALVLLTQSDPDVTGGLESHARTTSSDGHGVRAGLESLLRSVGAATRARTQGSADYSLSGSGGPTGLGSTPVKKAADNHRRGGWIAGKHRRNYSQAAAEIPSATPEDLDPVSPSPGLRLSGSSAVSTGGAGGTATNDGSHLRSAGVTPRQQRNVLSAQTQSTFGGAGSSYATATPTHALSGRALRLQAAAGDDRGPRSRVGADDDAESESGYLDSLRSPEISWSAASSPAQAESDVERAYAGLSRRSTDPRPAPVGLGPELVFGGGGGERRIARPGDERRNSSPPGTTSVSPGTAT